MFYDDRGRLKLADFGGGRIFPEKPQHPDYVPLYMSPEAAANWKAKATGGPEAAFNVYQSDVFSLGMIVLHAALLNLPQELYMLSSRQDSLQQCLAKVHQDYPNLAQILGNMLSPYFDRRCTYQDIVNNLSSDPESRMRAEMLELQQTVNPAGQRALDEKVDARGGQPQMPKFTSDDDVASWMDYLINYQLLYTADVVVTCGMCKGQKSPSELSEVSAFRDCPVCSNCGYRW